MSSWKRTFVCAWLAQLLSMTGFTFIMPLLPFYLKHLGIPDQPTIDWWQGVIGCAAGLAMVFTAPLWGILADRYGRKPMLLRSMFAGVVILGLMGFARGPRDILLLRFGQGVFTGTITASAALVASITPRRYAGLALGMIYGAVSGGMALGPLAAGILADRVSYRSTFLIASAVLLTAGALVALGTREHFVPPRPEERRKALSFRILFASSGFALACVICFLISFSNWARADIFSLLMQRLLGAGVSDTGLSGLLGVIGRKLAGVRGPQTSLNGLVLFVSGIGAMCAAPLWGRLGDRWGHKRAMMLCCALAGALAIPMAFSKSIGEVLVWSTLLWMAGAGTVPCINTIVRETIGTANIGKAYGLTQCVAALGWGLGPLSAGLLASYVDVWASFTLVGVVLLIVPFLAPFLPARRLPDP